MTCFSKLYTLTLCRLHADTLDAELAAELEARVARKIGVAAVAALRARFHNVERDAYFAKRILEAIGKNSRSIPAGASAKLAAALLRAYDCREKGMHEPNESASVIYKALLAAERGELREGRSAVMACAEWEMV